MARKNIRKPIGFFKRKSDNFFSIPEAFALNRPPRKLQLDAVGLKPNTRYKVMLDNFPGQQFEDITDFARPIGDSIKQNTHRQGNRGRMTYLKTDDTGKLSCTCMPFGSDSITSTGSASSGAVDVSKLWTQFRSRTAEVDKDRDKIKFVEYSQVNNPESDDKVKTVKFKYNEDTGDIQSNKGDLALPPGIILDASIPKQGKKKPKRESEVKGAFYQTFYVNSRSVGGEKTVDITDVVLYLRRKPPRKGNRSGKKLPGVNVMLLECSDDGSPDLSESFVNGTARAEWFETKASPLAVEGTRFEFSSPVTVETNKSYAIAVQPEDEQYIFWFSQKGDLLLVNGDKTERRSGGSSKEHQGDYYPDRTPSSPARRATKRDRPWRPDKDLDLKFDVNIAEYKVDDVSVNFVHRNLEFLQLTSSASKTWYPSEEVYKDKTADSTGVSITAGTKLITGTGMASVSDGDKLVLIDGTDSTIVQVFTVDESFAAASATKIYVSEYCERTISNGELKNTVVAELDVFDYDFNFMRLENSSVNVPQYTADNTKRFFDGDTVKGVESGATGVIASDGLETLDVSVFRTSWNGELPPEFTTTSKYQFAESTGTGLFDLNTTEPNMYLNAVNNVDYDAVIASRSAEVAQAANLHNPSSDAKSSLLNLSYTYNGGRTKVYSAPHFNLDELAVVTHRWRINNDSTNEHTNDGNALSKHISKKLEFNGQKAEDIRVILNAYRPRQTQIEVYAKIQNNDDSTNFDSKYWTKLDQIVGRESFSKSDDRDDYQEYEYTFPQYPPSASTLTGDYTATLDSATLTTSTGDGTDVSTGDVIKVYSPIFEENYGVFSVASSTSGSITLNEPVSNVNIASDGLKIDTLTTEYTAFKNIENDEIVRYFGTNGESYDNYNIVAIKIVLLAEDRKLVPKVDDYRVIGVSA